MITLVAGYLGKIRLSISARLALWYGLTLIVLMSLFALFSYVSFRTSMHHDFDRHLEHEQRQLIPYIEVGESEPKFTSLEDLHSVAYQTDGVFGTYVRLLSPGGDILYLSPNFEAHEPLPVQLPEDPGEATVSRDWEGTPVRSLYTPLVNDAGVRGWLEVTGFEWSLHRELLWMGQALIIGILLSLLLAVGGGYLLARRALSPVAALTAAANKIRAMDLSARLPTRFGVRDELTDLAETFNGMLDRLEASFNRERRFTANAAHELLTPLATIRSEIEVALRREREPAKYRESLARILTDVEEMSVMVRDLLQLSNTEKLKEGERQPVDLGEISVQHVERLRRRAEAKGIQVNLDVSEGAVVSGNAARLGEVLDNLLDNAIKYTPEGGQITVRVEQDEEYVRLKVSDTGTGFEPDQVKTLFDRFYRADTAEIQAQAGSGLGLSIVQAIVEAYGGKVSAFSPGLYKGSTFEVQFPRTKPVRHDAVLDDRVG